MTRVQSYTRTEQDLKTVRSVLDRALTNPRYKRAEVATRYENHSGEPALYIYVEMPSEKDIPELGAQNRLIMDLTAALKERGDERFPYLSFGPREGDDDRETVYESDED